jgi:hypothetical protein
VLIPWAKEHVPSEEHDDDARDSSRQRTAVAVDDVPSGVSLWDKMSLLPITTALLFGPPGEPVGTGWDIVLFPLITAVTIALLAAL